MASISSSPLLSSPPLLPSSILKPKPHFSIPPPSLHNTNHHLLISFPSTNYSSRKKLPHFPNSLPTAKSWKLSANLGNYSLSEANPVETSQEMVATGDNGVSVIISALLFAAFVGLSILTIGVIYIAVTDFLLKREREKFEKEEAAKKKRGGKKGKVRAKARAGGPKGFGQKLEGDDFDELD